MFAVLMPIGPGDVHVARMADSLETVRACEASEEIHLVLVDDHPTPRDLSKRVGADGWASLDVLRTPLWQDGAPDPYSAMVAGTIEGMRAAARHQPEFVLKLDTDTVMIGPVAHKLRRVFVEDRIGMVGSYTKTCAGDRRDWHLWEKRLRRATRTIAPSRRRVLRVRSPRDAREVRRMITVARRNGYEWGAHCLGGAYAVGPRLLEREDLLDWKPWVRTAIGEDVVVGLLSFAAGLHVRGHVEPGDPFALGWTSLPLPPEEIVARGYSLVHPLKDQAYGDERELREFFRRRLVPRRDLQQANTAASGAPRNLRRRATSAVGGTGGGARPTRSSS